MPPVRDRKSTRLNSSHMSISYAVFCLKKKKQLLRINARSIKTDNIHDNTYSAKEDLYEMFSRDNNGLASGFVTESQFLLYFFFNDTATTEIYTLSLHDALPI